MLFELRDRDGKLVRCSFFRANHKMHLAEVEEALGLKFRFWTCVRRRCNAFNLEVRRTG